MAADADIRANDREGVTLRLTSKKEGYLFSVGKIVLFKSSPILVVGETTSSLLLTVVENNYCILWL